MIKVGQIYKSKGKRIISCITAVGDKDFFVISPDGSSCGYNIRFAEMLELVAEKIAEYPTWVEAVNSEYFKND